MLDGKLLIGGKWIRIFNEICTLHPQCPWDWKNEEMVVPVWGVSIVDVRMDY